MKISVLIPTIKGREKRLEQTLDSFERTSSREEPFEYVFEKDDASSNWGTKIKKCADRATGDYLFCAADDIDLHPGWWEAAVAVCDAGLMPAPLVYNPDGTIQSCGNSWGEAEPDGSPALWSRFPFLSREQWERFGPTLPIHYSDVILGKRAARQGVECRVTHGFALTHHFAPEGRKDNDLEFLRRVIAEQLDEEGVDVWDVVARGPETAIEVTGFLPWDSDGILWRSCRLAHASDFAPQELGPQASPGPASGRGEESPADRP